MAGSFEDSGLKPWPVAHVCRDGVVRDLATFRTDQWPDESYAGGLHVVPGSSGLGWLRERAHAAKSLGRNGLDEIAYLAGRGPKPQ